MSEVEIIDFVGTPSETAWSRVEQWQIATGVQACVVFTVLGLQATATGHELVAHMRSHKPTSLEDLYQLLVHLITLTQERGNSLSFAAGFIEKKRSGWVSFDGQVVLQRLGKFGTITSGSELVVRSGLTRPDDVYVLATAGGISMIDETQALLFKGYELDGIISTLKSLLRTHPDADKTALAIIRDLPKKEYSSQLESTEVVSVATKPPAEAQAVQIETTAVTVESLEILTTVDELPNQSHHSTFVPRVKSLLQTFLSGLHSIVRALLRTLVHGWKIILRVMATARQGFRTTIRRLNKSSLVHEKPLELGQSIPSTRTIDTKKILIAAGLLLLTLLIISIVASAVSLWQRGIDEEVSALTQPYVNRLEQAEQLANLDPVRGREQLESLEEDVRTIQAQQTPGTPKREAIDELLTEVSARIASLIGSAELTAVPVWIDVQEKAPSFVTTNVSSLSDALFIIDAEQRKGFLVDYESAQATLTDLGSTPPIIDQALRSSTELFTLGDGIHTVAIPSGESTQLKQEGDSDRDGTLLAAFESFVYVFNPEKRNIYRYILRDTTLSDPIGWLVSPLGVSADMVHDMAVDGDIWLSTKDGELRKYSSGRATSFGIIELPEPLAGPLSVTTSLSHTYVYVFAPSQGRVVVLTKDGTFVKQIKSSVLSGATGVAVDEAQNFLYAVSGSVIYRVPIL